MIAVSIEQLNNKVCKELFNDILIKKEGYSFGKVDETISSVLGRNILKGTLTTTGKILVKILDTLDKDHCVKNIEGGMQVDNLLSKHNIKKRVQTNHLQAQLTRNYKHICTVLATKQIYHAATL